MHSNDFATELARATGKSAERKVQPAFEDKRQQKKETAPSIKDNPFFQIAISTPDPQAQKEAMIKLMTYVDAQTTAKNNQALSEYSAYMQSERQRLSVQLIQTTDTKTFSNMQRVLVDINNGVLDFEEQIKPFMETVNAVRLIQSDDATTDILSEMREDKKLAEELQANIRSIDVHIGNLCDAIKEKRISIGMHKENRGFFGLGDVRESSKAAIIALEVEIVDLEKEIESENGKKETLRTEARQASSKFEHLQDAKAILATMLDLSQEEHEARHQQLVNTASTFVTTTRSRVSDTLEHSVKMGSQIRSLSDLAFTMRGNYSVLSEAAKEAEKINSEAHEALRAELVNISDPLTKLNKEKVSRDLSKHITMLNEAASDTTNVIADLTISSQRIETMEAANLAQIKKTEQIQTSGIAGVADNLSSVLTAINQAAIGQASMAAQQSLRRMNDNTVGLTKEQMLNAAKARNDDNSALIKALEQLAGFGEVIDIANRSAQIAVEENRSLLGQLRETADVVNKAATETLEIVSTTITHEIESEKQ